MKNFIPLLCILLGLSACSQNNSSPNYTPGTASGVLVDYLNQNVHPGDDFNMFVNGGWIDTAEIPSDRPSAGVWLQLRETTENDVKAIVDEILEGDLVPGSKEQKVADLYTSYIDMETRNILGVSPLADEISNIDAIQNREQLARYFAQANKTGLNIPMRLRQRVDFKDPRVYMMSVWQGGLGLPDREFYFKEGQSSERIRTEYLAHIEKMFNLAGFSSASTAAQTIYALDTRIAEAHQTKEKNRDRVGLYNKFEIGELSDLMPNFAWEAYINEAGISGLETLVIAQPSYLEELDGILIETSIADWKTYLSWVVLNNNAGFLSEELDEADFEFYSATLRGVKEPLPLWRQAINTINDNLGEVVGEKYVAQHFPPEAKVRMLELIANLVNAYENSITNLEWMGEETRIQALDKLSKFNPMIGYPDEWRDYSDLEIERIDLLGNVRRSRLFDYERKLARQGGPVQRDEWGMNPQTVNAYYNGSLNQIVFPAAILQPPFFDMNAEDAINYGGIGAVIGHEIGHGFDDQGSSIDGDGVMRDWWTPEDKSEFKARTSQLVEQYSSFQPFEDLNVNGEFTLGENIGDLGGVSIALQAYLLSLEGEEPPVIDGFTGYQRFFIGWGQGWRRKARNEAVRNQIGTDPHSPAQYRVNGVVRNVPEFYEAFGVADSNKLYLSPADRVKIW